MGKAKWIWYQGDFEIRHGLLQNTVREERGMRWPAYWYLDDCRKNVKFSREYDLREETAFTATIAGIGYVSVNDRKYRAGEEILCPAGRVKVEVAAANPYGLPAVYVEGETIRSDETWSCSDMAGRTEPVGTSVLYGKKEQNPNGVWYEEEKVPFLWRKEKNGGLLFDFGREVTGAPVFVTFPKGNTLALYFGESEAEALDTEWCYYSQGGVTEKCMADQEPGEGTGGRGIFPRRAFRYLFVKREEEKTEARDGLGALEEAELYAAHQYIPYTTRGTMESSDRKLNRIWQVAEETFRLSCTLFILDGVKRDQWIWAGDVYQSLFVERYLFSDDELIKRTLLALRGREPMKQHINTIVDYSMLWIQAVGQYCYMSGDGKFLEQVLPGVINTLEYCLEQTDEMGFLYGREGDWIFVDWAELDREGVLCAEQVLLAGCIRTVGELLKKRAEDTEAGNKNTEEYGVSAASLRLSGKYRDKYRDLSANIRKYFWKEEKGAFIDSYQSGKNFVSRHSNLWAVVFGIADERQEELIIRNVLLNEAVPAITTPYFKFFELDVLGKAGYLRKVYDGILNYWGGMLEQGASTFWEEFRPEEAGDEKYGMYGDPFGKSLCHAWAASPIYLVSRYFAGVYPLSTGWETFRVEPKGMDILSEFHTSLPINAGTVEIGWKNGEIWVTADRAGGELLLDGKRYGLLAGQRVLAKRSPASAEPADHSENATAIPRPRFPTAQ